MIRSYEVKFRFIAINLLLISLMAIQARSFADGLSGALTLEPRQDPAVMTVTSVQLTDAGGVISAVGDMGEYGKVYATYEMILDPTRGLYLVSGEGRGFMQDGSFASGQFRGVAPGTRSTRPTRICGPEILRRPTDGRAEKDRSDRGLRRGTRVHARPTAGFRIDRQGFHHGQHGFGGWRETDACD